jgi:hypothetical protein
MTRAGAQARAKIGVDDEPRELRGQRLDVVWLEEQPGGAVAQRLLVDRQPRGDRHRPRRLRAREQPRRRGDAVGGRDEDIGAGERLERVVDELHALVDVGAQRDRRRRAALGVHDRLPRQLRVQATQRAQEDPQRPALLLLEEGDAHALVLLRRARDAVGAGRHDLVVAREEAPQELGGGAVGGGARVEATEHELDDLARDLGGDDALGRGMEGADVQRARVAQGRARDAGRERLVDVADVERGVLEEVGDRPGDVDRQGGAAAAGQRRQGFADREHAGLAGLRIERGRAHRRTRLAHELVRDRRRDDEHAVPAARELLRDAVDEEVDVVTVLPGVRGDLGDGQGLGHRPAG